ncbi:MAG: ParB/RepB/Spo0J family partition protein [Candidatus Pacebacteria bacterium]|nr:ParB/RepB/Spo0J family partition protein [Candidatus Paceibacterota bacterium]
MAFQGDSIYWVEVEKVVPNPFQPRLEFDKSKLQELADSIRMYGVLQPLTVTRSEVQKDDGTFYTEYELIAGERRLRASKLAGIAQVPVIIREGEQSEQEKLELAIIENLQREDLNAVDRALAFRQLSDVFKLSHVEVAKKVGRSREYVSNTIRLLGLPDKILSSLTQGDMSEGHARTLLMLTDRPEEQDVIFREILLKKMSVREVERIVRKIATDKVRKKNSNDIGASLIEIEKQFTETLGTRVQIQKTDFGGKLTIDYFSEEDLEVILKRVRDESNVDASSDQKAAEKIAANTPLETVPESATTVLTASPVVKEVQVVEAREELLPTPDVVRAPLIPAKPVPAVTEENVVEQKTEEVPVLIKNEPQPEVRPLSFSPQAIMSTPVAETVPQVQSEKVGVPAPSPEPVAKTESKDDKDDSSLYSMRSFNV